MLKATRVIEIITRHVPNSPEFVQSSISKWLEYRLTEQEWNDPNETQLDELLRSTSTNDLEKVNPSVWPHLIQFYVHLEARSGEDEEAQALEELFKTPAAGKRLNVNPGGYGLILYGTFTEKISALWAAILIEAQALREGG